MPLETATMIHQLDIGNPVDTDNLGASDDHLRLIKSALKTSLPNITGVVTASHTDLNTIPGVAARVTAMEANRLRNDISQTLTGHFGTTGSVFSAGPVFQGGNVLIPYGVIVMWAGIYANVPAGWALCNGTNGTPNLTDRFVVAAGGGANSPNTAGGSAGGNFVTDTQGSHSHGGAVAGAGGHGHSASADVQGQHSHGGVTWDTVLTVAQLPPHSHGFNQLQGSSPASYGSGSSDATVPLNNAPANTGNTGGGAGHNHNINPDGAHGHNITIGGVGDHQHGIYGDGAHAHNVTVSTVPPYYALCFIMKL